MRYAEPGADRRAAKETLARTPAIKVMLHAPAPPLALAVAAARHTGTSPGACRS